MTDVTVTEAPVTVAVGEDVVYLEVAAEVSLAVSEAGLQGPEGPAHEVFPFSMMDEVGVFPGTARIYWSGTGVIESVQASVGTAPTGQDIIVDVNINGVTIFTTQANRPTISDGAYTSGAVTSMDIDSLVDGDYVTVDVDQVGSGEPGRDLTVLVRIAKN